MQSHLNILAIVHISGSQLTPHSQTELSALAEEGGPRAAALLYDKLEKDLKVTKAERCFTQY